MKCVGCNLVTPGLSALPAAAFPAAWLRRHAAGLVAGEQLGRRAPTEVSSSDTDPDHDPRHEVAKDLCHHWPGEGPGDRVAARLDEVNNNRAIAR